MARKLVRTLSAMLVFATFAFVTVPPGAALTVSILTVTHPTAASFDDFGHSLAMGDDFFVVGSPSDDAPSGDSGSAHVYDLTGARRFSVFNPTDAGSDQFGWAVAASDSFIGVGARLDDAGAGDAGAAYSYDRNGVLLRTILNPTPASSDHFGDAVAVVGTRLVVGAPRDDTGAADAGSAYVFDATSGALLATIPNPLPQSSDFFADSLFAVDDTRFFVGAFFDNPGGVTDAGSAYLYDVTGALLMTIPNPLPAFGDHFGEAFALYDGDFVTSAPGKAAGGLSAAGVLFLLDGATGAMIRTFTEPTPEANDGMGTALAASPFGILAGSYQDDDSGFFNTGEAVFFDPAAGTARNIPNPAHASSDHFGFSVAVSGDLLIVGAPLDDLPSTNAGRVFFYDGSDLDADDVEDVVDNCPLLPNTDQADLDGDAVGNVCDGDRDGDLLSNDDETTLYGTDPDDADTDGEGLTDGAEVLTHGTDPLDTDTDEEGLTDYDEVAVHGTSPLDPDCDDDGLTDRIEIFLFGTDPLVADTDGDAVDDAAELTLGLDPLDADTDGDGATDGDELAAGTDPLDADTDDDGLVDGDEVAAGTDAFDPDSDDDGLLDGPEVDAGTDPLDADSDDDGLLDGPEVFTWGTDPLAADTDADTLSDGDEVFDHGTNPLDSDTDADGLSDADELGLGTDPLAWDTDGDGLGDGDEVAGGTDPLAADTDGDGVDDGDELGVGTDPLDADTDDDGLDDSESTDFGTDALDDDTDDDNLTDGDEVNAHGSDPLDQDTDGDLFGDATEVAGGSDPSNPTSVPTPAGPLPGLEETDSTELDVTDGIEPVA